MQSEWNKGASCCRDTILAAVMGMQNELGNNEADPKYQILQELLLHIEKNYGCMMQKYKA